MEAAQNPPAGRYTPEDKRRGLTALVLSGTLKAAADATGLKESTIAYWRDRSDRELYQQLHQEHAPKIAARDVADLDEAIAAYARIEAKVAERIENELPSLQTRELPQVIANVSKAKAVAIDKRQLLTGQATEIVQVGDARDLLGEIKRMIEPASVDSTAEEIA